MGIEGLIASGKDHFASLCQQLVALHTASSELPREARKAGIVVIIEWAWLTVLSESSAAENHVAHVSEKESHMDGWRWLDNVEGEGVVI